MTKKNHKTQLLFLSVIGKDKPGIIAEITKQIASVGFNLEDVMMSLLDDQFSMMMVISLSKNAQKESLIQLLQKKMKTSKRLSHLHLSWYASSESLKRASCESSPNVKRVLITVLGPDQVGIVHQVSQILFQYGANITDLNSKILGASGKKCIYSLMLEADISSNQLAKLQKSLGQTSKKLSVEIQVKEIQVLSL